MNHVLNERGESIISVGQDKSIARMAVTYPDTIQVLIKRLSEPEPLMVKHCRDNNANASDMYHLINAAIYYFKNKINPLT